MFVRFFRFLWPGIVLLVVVGAYALSLHYFESSTSRAAGVAAISGFILVVIGVILAVVFVGSPKNIDDEKIKMGFSLSTLIAIFALVPMALTVDVVYGVATMIAYALVSFLLVDYHNSSWDKVSNADVPQWFWAGQLFPLGFATFVLFPNVVGVVSVLLCVAVYCVLIDREMLRELITPKKKKVKTA